MFKKVRVTEGNKALDVYVPKTDDRVEQKDLMDFAIGKTKEDLREKEIFNRNKKPVDPAEAKALLKEAQDYKKRKEESCNKRVFGGITLGSDI